MVLRPALFAAAALATLLAGCASAPRQAPPPPTDPTLAALDRSAAEVSRSITALAEVEQYDRFKREPQQPRSYEQVKDMTQVVTMPWEGPVEAAVRQLAQHAGYTLKVIGRSPVIPILVQIGAQPATVSDLLRNVGLQAGARADVIVYPEQRIVELRYSDAAI